MTSRGIYHPRHLDLTADQTITPVEISMVALAPAARPSAEAAGVAYFSSVPAFFVPDSSGTLV